MYSPISTRRGVCVSIVSHQHGSMVTGLVRQLEQYQSVLRIIVTYNVKEDNPLPCFGKVTVIHNTKIKGFGSNHNHAFSHCREEFFCVLNPDVTLLTDPFPILIAEVSKKSVDIVAPSIFDITGQRCDSARAFPSLSSLASRTILGRREPNISPGKIASRTYPYWIGGMFMMFRADSFKKLAGFDELFFLYVEDVDICQRALLLDMSILKTDQCSVIHDARRASRKNIRHAFWHVQSLIRYFLIKKTP